MNSAPQRKDPHLFGTDESSGYIIVPLNTYSVNEGTEEMLDVQTGVDRLVKGAERSREVGAKAETWVGHSPEGPW